MFTEGTTVEVSFGKENNDVWHVGTVMKVTGANKCLVKFQCPRDGNEDSGQEFALSDVRPSPPCVEDNVFSLRDEVEAYFECSWWSGVIEKVLVDRKYRVLIKHSEKKMKVDHVNLRPRRVWTDGKWSNEAKLANRPGVLTRQSGRLNRPETRTEEQQSGKVCASAEKKDYTEVHVEEIVDEETTEVDLSVKEVKGARSAKNSEVPRKKDQKKQSRNQEIPVDSIERLNEISTTVDEIPKNGDFQPSSPSKECPMFVYTRRHISKVPRQNGVLRKTVDIESHYRGALSVGRKDDSGAPPFHQENAVESALLQKKDGPGDLPVENFNQCAASNDKSGGHRTPAIIGIDTMENEQSLPFVKRSRIWKYIDPMETYEKMTQKPHFAPLYEHAEEKREGLAVGRLVNFFNLVEDTSKLHLSSDIAVIERGLKSLDGFKSHGFDVEKVEAILTQLLLKKQQAEEFLRKDEDIRSEILNSVEEFREAEKKFGEAKLKKEKALSALHSELETVEENLKSLQVEFESIVRSL